MGNTYRAFISYSHRDAPVARWLHARLETYRLPADLGQLSPAGERKARLGPIFRDREELPAAEDLSAAVRAALAASDVLVVLCSPDAQTSPWVAREIELFRELGPDRPILAAIVRGEPGDAFPRQLLEGLEPLAADLRKQGDGRRLGFLKVVAGIAGVPLDTLVQRDAQRKLRRVMAVTLATAAATLAMAIMTVIAIQSRNDARQQRAAAEGLIGYMVTDLRGQLRGVGRLDVMAGVNQQALQYFEDQDLASLDDRAMEQHLRVVTDIRGNDLRTVNRRPITERRLAELFALTAARLERSPDDPERIFNHAQSEHWVGYVSYLHGDLGGAHEHWSGYRRLAQALVRHDRRNARWQRELAYAEGNLCTVLMAQKDTLAGAMPYCERAGTISGAVARTMRRDIEVQLDFANRIAWLADAHLALGEKAEALKLRREQLAFVKSTFALGPSDARIAEAHLLALLGLATTAVAAGEETVAQTAVRRARSEADSLRRLDRRNSDWLTWQQQVAQMEAALVSEKP